MTQSQSNQQYQTNVFDNIHTNSYTQVQPQPCPTCGTCPTCGRKGYQTYPSYPDYPYTYPYNPSWPYTNQQTGDHTR